MNVWINNDLMSDFPRFIPPLEKYVFHQVRLPCKMNEERNGEMNDDDWMNEEMNEW